MTKNWKRYFEQYNRSSIDENGIEKVYGNSMEELYQMFNSNHKKRNQRK